jgi:hypothetical protein
LPFYLFEASSFVAAESAHGETKPALVSAPQVFLGSGVGSAGSGEGQAQARVNIFVVIAPCPRRHPQPDARQLNKNTGPPQKPHLFCRFFIAPFFCLFYLTHPEETKPVSPPPFFC